MVKIVEAIAETLRHEMHRGMGADFLSPLPVNLEPPFSRFQHSAGHTDRGASVTPVVATEVEVIPPSDLRFLKVRLSAQDNFDLRLSEQLMLAFSPLHPVAFEVLGQAGSVSFQFAASEQDVSNIVGQVHSHHPGAQIFERSCSCSGC